METSNSRPPIDPAGNIIVIDQSSGSRGSIMAALREIGFMKATGVGTIRDAVNFLESEKCTWILCTMILDGEPNVMQLLKMGLIHPELRDTRISVFAGPEELAAVRQSLALGAISYHDKNFSKQALTDEFARFKAVFAKARGDGTQIAADYIRAFLKKGTQHADLLKFEQAMMGQFPANSAVLMDLARAQALAGETEQAAATLGQILILDASKQEEVERVRTELLHGLPLAAAAGARGTNLLGLKKVFVVDGDTAALAAAESMLGMIGAESCQLFSNPEDALKKLKEEGEVDLIIHEWRLPKVNGPLFIQRVRQLGHDRAPIVLLSSLVTAQDQNLTREMGVARVIEKPLRKEDFLEGIIWTMKQEVKPTDIKIFERKILALLAKRRFDDAVKVKERLIGEFKASKGATHYFDAEIDYARGKYEDAKLQAIEGIKLGFNSVRMFNLLGKTLMRLRDFEAAIKCFEKAQAMSPMNVLRLCAMADCNCELKKTTESQDQIDKAKQVDAGNDAVGMSEANLALSSGDLQRATKILRQLPNLDDVISYLNNRGIMTARAGHAEEAISFYNKVIEALPETASDKSATVRYNLALAHARGGELEKAVHALKTIGKAPDAHLAAKVASLQKRLAESIAKGTPFALNSDAPAAAKKDASVPDVEVAPDASVDVEALSTLAIGPGDVGCYAIFTVPPDEALDKLAKKVPVYKPRETIKRAESGGIERMMKR